MADEPPKGPPKSKHELELEEAGNKAWGAARDATAEYGRAQYRLGRFRGFVDGYLQAKKDAIQELESKVAAPPVPPKTIDTPPPRPVTVPLAPTMPPAAASVPIDDLVPKSIVLNAVKIFPGLRGAELLREIHKTGVQLHERTLRTILFRNKVPKGQRPKDGQLVNFEKRWYVFPAVPAGYQHELETEGISRPKTKSAVGDFSLTADP